MKIMNIVFSNMMYSSHPQHNIYYHTLDIFTWQYSEYEIKINPYKDLACSAHMTIYLSCMINEFDKP